MNTLKSDPSPVEITTGAVLDGTFFSGKNDVGYVRIPDHEHAIEVSSHLRHTALHRDKVKVEVLSTDNTTGATGKVLEINRRSQYNYICVLEKRGGDMIVAVPNDRYNRNAEFVILPEHANGAILGDTVAVDISLWQERTKPLGKVTKILGNDINGIMEGLAITQGFEEGFPEDVQKMAEEIEERGITEEDLEGRLDIRDILTFTIDPDNAKDFDDALSYHENPDGTLTIGVHIADVTHYVRPGTPLDDEARERATSVYLVDRTIPMLPEELSNNLCSLRPREDRLAFSVIWTMQPNGNVIDAWYGRTVIHSDERLTYQQAFEYITGENKTEPYAKAITTLDAIAKRYKEERFNAGALSLEKEELRFVIDEQGEPLEVRTKIRNDAHKMIEEWMLLANRYVATYLSKENATSFMVYRIHPRPDVERVQELKVFLEGMGYKPSLKDGIIPNKELRTIVASAENHYEKDVLSLAIARSMQKAIYSTENIGHYGLGFVYYTHFTSPIRRYPDAMVHRLLQGALDGKTMSKEQYDEYNELTAHSSERERNASIAERESVNYMQAKYMEKHIGKIFTGMVTGVSRHGVFVSELETKCEGRASLRDIEGDYFSFDKDKNTIVGQKTGRMFKLGNQVKIKVIKVNIADRQIDYKILSEGKPQRPGSPKKPRGQQQKNFNKRK